VASGGGNVGVAKFWLVTIVWRVSGVTGGIAIKRGRGGNGIVCYQQQY